VDAVTIEHALYFGRGLRRVLAERWIRGVVHHLDAAGRNLEHCFHVAPGGARYSEHAIGARQPAPQIK
jgi:hypothetical protein